jgi:Fe-S oxidoreductase
MGVEDKCTYRRSFENGTTTFEDVKNRPDHKLYGCMTCSGYEVKCPYYITPQLVRLTYAQKEIREKYPGVFGIRTEEFAWP